ncbi:MAG: AAA family ATPase [Pseudomonadota bacterium]|nr:AAA family ATPase [Pseudomonadota bacterium]
MFNVAVVNLKGGCGKTTLSTQLAARYARDGHRTILVDLDRQQSALGWVRARPTQLPTIEATAGDIDALVVPFGEGRTVFDVPAGMKRKALEVVVRAADVVLVPILPSRFDEAATERLLGLLREIKPVRTGKRPVWAVGNRLRTGTVARAGMESFLDRIGLPPVAFLAESKHYAEAAQSGQTLFDIAGSRHRALRAQWAPLLVFLDRAAAELEVDARSR